MEENQVIDNKKKKLIFILVSSVTIILIIAIVLILSIFQSPKTTEGPHPSPTSIETGGQTRKILPSPTPMIYTEGSAEFSFKDKSEIDNLIYSLPGETITRENVVVSGYYLIGNWAIVSTEPKKPITDNANIILKKEGGLWKIFIGPRSYFDSDELISLGVPKEVAEKAIIIPIALIFEISPEL